MLKENLKKKDKDKKKPSTLWDVNIRQLDLGSTAVLQQLLPTIEIIAIA